MSEDNETIRSIFGRTESIYTAPEFNEGVPRGPARSCVCSR